MKLRLLLAFLCVLCGHVRAAEKLNVLLIMADDLRDYGGAFTRDVVKTPNLDRLRARGTAFQRAYVQYPVCNPSRSSMMTGLRAEQTGIVGNDTRLREKMPDVVTLPQLFKDAGWQSHAFGKLFHLGGGKNEQARQQWMDTGRSWHTAQAFEATKTGEYEIGCAELCGMGHYKMRARVFVHTPEEFTAWIAQQAAGGTE